MSQRLRRNKSPTFSASTAGSAASGGGGAAGSGGANASTSSISRLLPMKATVPFQLRPQAQSQPHLQTRLAHGADSGCASLTRGSGCEVPGTRTSTSLSRSPTRAAAPATVASVFSQVQPLLSSSCSAHASPAATVGTHTVTSAAPSPRGNPSVTSGATARPPPVPASLSAAPPQQITLSPRHVRAHTYCTCGGNNTCPLSTSGGGSPCASPTQQLPDCSVPAAYVQPLPLSDTPSGASSSSSAGSQCRPQQPQPQRWSPEHGRQSPERRSPSSPLAKEWPGTSSPPSASSRAEKPRLPLALPPHGCAPAIRRTSSLDTLTVPYLSGHWPRDGSHAHSASCMRDRATQTPSAWADEFSEKRRSSHKRSASWGSTDQLKEIAKLRQQLQRSKHSSRQQRDKDRKSPFNGCHTAVCQSQALIPKSVLIPIPTSKSTACRFRNSVEGLNQEIERIIIRDPGERDEHLLPQDAPDGHRAPPPLLHRSSSTRSIDTQTPLGGGGPVGGGNHSNSSSRSHSTSPTFLAVTNDVGADSPFTGDDLLTDSQEKDLCPSSPLPKYASSPKPNNSYVFKREPPEGCERVRVFEETPSRSPQEIPPFLCPDKNKVNFIPKSGSAFCLVSILKPLLPTQDLTLKASAGLGGGHGPTPSAGPAPLGLEVEQRTSRGTSTSSQQPCFPWQLEEMDS